MSEHDAPKDEGSPNLNQLVRDIQPRIQAILKPNRPSPNMRKESLANAVAAAKELIKNSKLLAGAVAAASLTIKTALYDLETGKVEFEK